MDRLVKTCITLALAAPVILSAVVQAAGSGTSPANRTTGWHYCGGPLGGLGYDVRMHPGDQDTMFVTDSFAGVFRSEDGGLTWESSSDGITTYGGASGDALKAFCLTVDPNDPNIVWCGLQNYRGIYKSTDGGRSWTAKEEGVEETEGLSIRGFTIEPGNSDVVYAAGEVSSYAWSGDILLGREFDRAMGVLYKTDDGGDHWNEVWRDSSLARYVWIDPRDTDVLYLSTGFFDREAANTDTAAGIPGGLGVLKSTDGGLSWERKNNGLTNLFVPSLFMNPEDPDVLLAAADNGSWPDSGGVFLTTDGAESWTRVLEENVQSVEISVGSPGIAYAGNPNAFYRSENGGHDWIQMTPGGLGWGPPGVQAGFPVDLQVDPDDSNRVFTNNYGGGNFLSTDGGHTWTIASTGYTGAHVRDVAVAPHDPARVYAAARSGLFATDDWGVLWSGLIHSPAWGLEWNVVAVDPHDPVHVLAANNWDTNIVESRDGADTWRSTGHFLPESMGWRCFEFAPSDSLMIYAGSGAFQTASTFDPRLPALGIHKSEDGGQTWEAVNDSLSEHAHVAGIAIQQDNPSVVYAATGNLGILKTTLGGFAWQALNGVPPDDALPTDARVLSVAIDPDDSDHIFAGLDDAGLYESFDGAATWNAVAAGLPAESDVTSIVYSPVDSDLVLIGDQRSGVYISTDDGASWSPFNSGLRYRAVNDLEFSADGQHLYAGTEGEGVYLLESFHTGVSEDDPVEPVDELWLHQSRANPFGGSTTISFVLRNEGPASLKVFDVSGRLVRVLLDEALGEGPHDVVWDGRDEEERAVASGVYFYRLEAGGLVRTRRMVLVR